MESHQSNDEIFMVPVPKSHLGAVYKVLANPATEPGAASGPAGEAIEVQGQGPWTASMISELEADLELPAIRALITLDAERAPKPLTFAEAVKATGVEAKLLRAQLGSLTKTTKRLFGEPIWPMSVRYGEAGYATYSMAPRVAEWWIEAVAGRTP